MEENIKILKKALQTNKVEEFSLCKGLIQSYISSNGVSELFEFYKLREFLFSNNVSLIEIQQIILLLQVEGAKQLFLQNNVSNNDIQKFMKIAQQTSGLNTETILKIMDILLQETKLSEKISGFTDFMNVQIKSISFSIPYNIYLSEIHRIKVKMENDDYDGALKITTSLLPTGIAEVKYLHAECLKRSSEKIDVDFIINLEKEAANDGYSLAALSVADYYYSIQEYAYAYHYYMGYGAPLLSEEQRRNVTCIENLRLYNQQVLKKSCLIEAFIILTLILSFFGNIYASYWFLGLLVVLFTVFVLYVRQKYLKNVNPFDVNNTYILYIVLPWALYMFIRIWF